MDQKKPATQQLAIRIPDSVGQGSYANIVSINASDQEVVLDFVLNVPNGQAILTNRVVISHVTAQQLSDILEALLRQRRIAKDIQK
ncbi:MAG TPA: DUF3467 domain-containing protein [Patescibacteria group bacterium]|nr:DUF3467 domain-containing protein [Patescibacteria group bacterium]